MKSTILFLLFLIHCFASGAKSSTNKSANPVPSKNSTLHAPDFSTVKGIILQFKNEPNKNEETSIIEKMTQKGLEKKSEIKRFKVWLFESQKEKTIEEVQNICKNLSKLSSIKYCEPDAPLNTTDELAFTTDENEEEVEDKNLKTCNIIDSKIGLLNGQLSDYWAQEMIGSDLMKEEIQQLPPIKEHLVECFDQKDHGVAVKNLISDKGKHSILPDVGNSMTVSQNYKVSDFLKNSDKLLTKVDKTCGAAPTNTGSVQ